MNLLTEQHLTHGILGWYSPRITESDSGSTTQGMCAAFGTSRPMFLRSHNTAVCSSSAKIENIGATGFTSVVGLPHWRLPKLQDTARREGHSQALSMAYAEYGERFIEYLGGAYSFILHDPDNDLFMIGTDRTGQFPLYYQLLGDSVIFGPSASTVLAHPSLEPKLLDQGIYSYVYFHMVPSPASIYEGVKKLQAAQYLKVAKGKTTVHRYWVPNFIEKPGKTFLELGIELRENLKKSVDKVFEREKRTAAFLSGGLDSSTVAGMLAELSDGPAHAYSIGFDAEGYDEMAFARITAKHFGIELHEYYVTPEDVVEALPHIATSYDEPFGNSSALPAWFCAKFAAEDHVEVLLAGDGGDELFAGNSRYAKQKVFEYYSHVPSWIRNMFLQPIVNSLPATMQLASKGQRYIELAKTALPERLQAYNFLNQHDPEEIFQKEFLKNVSTSNPVEIQNEIYAIPDGASTLNKMLYLDWQFTLADNDLRKVSHMCSLAGVEVAYPMLDDELIELSCLVPSHWKLKGRNLRHFYKQSLTGWLPDETISKKKQGFGLPFGIWMQTHQPLQELAYDNLLQLKKRHYFNGSFIDKVIHLHRGGHAAYYGELVWIMTVFELWLQGHEKNPH